MSKANEPAFPRIDHIALETAYNKNQGDVFVSGGLTKREYFAAMAMQGLAANSWLTEESIKAMEQGVRPTAPVELAVNMADALLAELEKAK